MSQAIDFLFCASACKSVQLKLRSQIWFKICTLIVVSLLFMINFAGCTVQFVFSRTHLYQLIIYPIYLYFFVQTAFNYFMTAFLSPGYSNECTKQIDRTCSICNCVKPFRTRHCSICDKCITKWDHHCPWVQQCIGYWNYGQFLNLMFWSSVCLTYSFLTLLSTFIVHVVVDRHRNLVVLIVPAVAFVVTAAFGFAVDKLFLFHVNLVAHNMTTIEYHETVALYRQDSTYKHPYDTASKKQNFREVVPHIWRIFVPGLRIYPAFDPYYSYDHKFKKDLRCDFDFNEEKPEMQIANTDADALSATDNGGDSVVRGQNMVLTLRRPQSLRSDGV